MSDMMEANTPKVRALLGTEEVNKWHRAAMRALGDNEARRKWADSKPGGPVTVMLLCEDVSRLQIMRDNLLSTAKAFLRLADRNTVEANALRAAIAQAEGAP